jgi:hypothetical protein
MWTGDLDNIDQVALYMNEELQKGRSQKEIEINDFKVNEKVIKNRLSRKRYKKHTDINQWVLAEDNEYDKSDTQVITIQQPKKNERNISNTEVINEYDNDNTLVIADKNIKNNLINLAKNYDKIMSIVQGYDKKYDKEYDGLTIELPVETIKDFRTSIRVNNVIWEQFNQFTNTNKEFTKRDLLSMALKVFMDKHNK